jgi:hypothetical protein
MMVVLTRRTHNNSFTGGRGRGRAPSGHGTALEYEAQTPAHSVKIVQTTHERVGGGDKGLVVRALRFQIQNGTAIHREAEGDTPGCLRQEPVLCCTRYKQN